MLPLTRREEYRQYIRQIYTPNMTYQDVERIAMDMGLPVDYVKGLFKDLRLPYVTKNEMARLNRERYLTNVWAKQPRETRLSIEKLSEVLHCTTESLHKDIKRLGLENYALSNSELSSRSNQEKRDTEKAEFLKYLKNCFAEYKKTGRQFFYEEIALNSGMPYRFVKIEVRNSGYISMIKPYQETCTKGQRMNYYRQSREFLRKNLNLLRLSVKFGLPMSQIRLELNEAGIIRNYEDDYTNIDARRDGYTNPSSFSYEDLNRMLGVSKGTYREDKWGTYDY